MQEIWQISYRPKSAPYDNWLFDRYFYQFYTKVHLEDFSPSPSFNVWHLHHPSLLRIPSTAEPRLIHSIASGWDDLFLSHDSSFLFQDWKLFHLWFITFGRVNSDSQRSYLGRINSDCSKWFSSRCSTKIDGNLVLNLEENHFEQSLSILPRYEKQLFKHYLLFKEKKM